MNINKHREFFDPTDMQEQVHIIGVGAVGSTVAELLARLGVKEVTIYDMDAVEDVNIANQMFRYKDIGRDKVDAVENIVKEINPDIIVNKFNKGWDDTISLSGYVFLCADKISVRQDVVKTNMYNPNLKGIFDFRMRLTDAQHYACDNSMQAKKCLLSSMNFTEEEAAASTPLSACGTTLSVVPTVREVVNVGVINFMNMAMGNGFKKVILVQPFIYEVDAM